MLLSAQAFKLNYSTSNLDLSLGKLGAGMVARIKSSSIRSKLFFPLTSFVTKKKEISYVKLAMGPVVVKIRSLPLRSKLFFPSARLVTIGS